ncbi:AraC-like DNA-binding protein [Paenibacillus sp. V4I3]|uniref:AraC family transcriptional regulator n=1 Tax=Paenibacillus sp. V4I3 TaxID=3042305 RepID=UPI002786B794|nr:AraC family transcriptional regulator [Paenibacillus sp. V4I3]MDQ0873659.1 AraC-like DNA-binding protein [Paenibacillus sp. V4I3]
MSNLHVQNDYDFNISSIGNVYEREPNPHWKYDRIVNHDAYIIAFCKDGEALYGINGKEISVKKGDLLFFPKGLVRSASSNPMNPWSFYTVAFDIQFLNENSQESLDRLDHVTRSPHLYRLPSLFAELNLVWSGKRSGFVIKCKSIIMDILYHLIKEQDRTIHGSAHYNAIEQTANLILSNYKNHFSIDELAKLADMSDSHFRLLFKKITGMTAIQYQNHIRINKAKDLLLSGECNVTEAALSVGFQDIYYFSRLFKKLTGANPSDYITG